MTLHFCVSGEWMTGPVGRIVAMMLMVGLVSCARERDEKTEAVDPGLALVRSAETAYKSHSLAYEAGTADFENLYLWSRRWMDAELRYEKDPSKRRSSMEAHRERMSTLHKRVEAAFQAGAEGGEANKLAAASYYVAETDRLLADAD